MPYVESLGFIGLIALALAMVVFAYRRFTNRGKAHLLSDNTQDLIAVVDQTCVRHGWHAIDDLVILDGEPHCPVCVKESLMRRKGA